MNKFDLQKNQALKLAGQLKQSGTPDRFGTASQLPDRREQRKLDQAAGLVPFPLLSQAHADQIRAMAVARGVSTNEIVAELLQKALDA